MLDHVTLVSAIFVALAAVYGLCSRSFLTALVAGVFLALIHAGLVVLVGLQAGSLSLTELPYLKDGVDLAIWKSRFGLPPATASAHGVPEPGGRWLAMPLAAGLS